MGLLHHGCSSHPSPVPTALTQMRRKHPGEQEVEGDNDLPACACRDTVLRISPPAQPSSPQLCTYFFSPTPSLGAFLQTLEECKSPAGPRGAPSRGVWAPLSRQKNQTGLVSGSNTHPSNSRSPALSPSPPGGTSARVCPSESGQRTHHRVMEEQLPGLMKFLIAQHVHKVFEEITWDQRDL